MVKRALGQANLRAAQQVGSRVFRVLVMGALIGSISAIAATVFVFAVIATNEWLLWRPREHWVRSGDGVAAGMLMLVPIVGGLIVGYLHSKLPNQRPQTIADAIVAVQLVRGRVKTRQGMLSGLTALLSLGVGASSGQYGPVAHLGATLGARLSTPFGKSPAVGNIAIACGVSAAIATTFNAPLAGILFAHEVILRHFSLRAFAPVTVAAVIGYIFAEVILHHAPVLDFREAQIDFAIEYLIFAAMGIVGALVAVVFMRSLFLVEEFAERSRVALPVRPAIAGVLVGIALLYVPEVAGIGLETLRGTLLDNSYTAPELAVFLVLKMGLTAVCLGMGFAGGVFSPALLIGMLFGALTGMAMDLVAESAHSVVSVYALCGMAAVASPVIGAPITAILMVFELTRNYEITTAAMLCVVFSNLVAYRIFGRSFFDEQIKRRGIDFSIGREGLVLGDRRAVKYATSNFVTVDINDSLDTLAHQFEVSGEDLLWVTDGKGELHGVVSAERLRAIVTDPRRQSSRAIVVAEMPASVFTRETTLEQAIERSNATADAEIPIVISEREPVLVGMISKADIIRAYRETVESIREEQDEML